MKTRALSFVLLLLATTLRADGAGTTAAPFLKVPFGARGVAMGGAYASVAQGAEALYWNPAGVALLRSGDASFSYAPIQETMNYGSLGIAYPLTKKSSIGLAFASFSQEPLETMDASGRPTGTVSPSDSLFQATYSRLEGPAAWGVSLKQIRSQLADVSASALAWDAGARMTWGGRFTASAGLRNMGKGLRYDRETSPLPRSQYLGASWNAGKAIIFSSQVETSASGEKRLGLGAEWTRPMGSFSTALRAGYDVSQTVTGFKVGFGVDKGALSIDYALAPMGELGQTHWMTLGYRFAEKSQ